MFLEPIYFAIVTSPIQIITCLSLQGNIQGTNELDGTFRASGMSSHTPYGPEDLHGHSMIEQNTQPTHSLQEC